jgi:hypothetical protein
LVLSTHLIQKKTAREGEEAEERTKDRETHHQQTERKKSEEKQVEATKKNAGSCELLVIPALSWSFCSPLNLSILLTSPAAAVFLRLPDHLSSPHTVSPSPQPLSLSLSLMRLTHTQAQTA